MKTTLVVLAAGIGSRFGGGIKQLTPMGPNGEIIMDYAIYDAKRAGFDKVVFIIRKDLEQDFKSIIGDRIAKVIETDYAFQEIDNLPAGFSVPEGRKKPWGTGQALLAVRGKVNEPFVVINADDYYGPEGFRAVHKYMTEEMDLTGEKLDMCMAGFILKNTLSDNGTVTRGVCEVDERHMLKSVRETGGGPAGQGRRGQSGLSDARAVRLDEYVGPAAAVSRRPRRGLPGLFAGARHGAKERIPPAEHRGQLHSERQGQCQSAADPRQMVRGDLSGGQADGRRGDSRAD